MKSPKDVINFFKLNLPVLFLMVILAVIGYANVLNGQFLSADDISSIVQNPKIRQFG
ncbi:hypothetical protein KJ605_02000 [Patescibacteria group bacterium]|nr:hypothetical protein [Patescibacteria group bacterium]